MYTQAMDIPSGDRDEAPVKTDAQYEAEFEAKLARGDFIEPKDWMPETLSQDADPADQPARALGDRRHAARRRLDHARADARAQMHPAGQGAG